MVDYSQLPRAGKDLGGTIPNLHLVFPSRCLIHAERRNQPSDPLRRHVGGADAGDSSSNASFIKNSTLPGSPIHNSQQTIMKYERLGWRVVRPDCAPEKVASGSGVKLFQ